MSVPLVSTIFVNFDVSGVQSTGNAAVTLIHAFVTSCVDYCNAVFTAAPKVTTNKLQRVLNAAARVVMAHGSLIAACLSCFTLNFIVKYKVSVMVHRCLN